MLTTKQKRSTHKTTIGRAWSLLRPDEQRRGIITLALMVVSGISAAAMIASIMPFLSVLAQPARIESQPLLAKVHSFFVFKSDYTFLLALGFSSLCMIILSNLIQMGSNYSLTHYTQRCGNLIGYRLFRAYLSQPYAFFLSKNSADLGTQILSESQAVMEHFFQPMGQAIASCCTVVMIVSLLIFVNPAVALIALSVLSASYGLVFHLVRGRLALLGNLRTEANRARFQIANEAFSGIKGVKLEGREGMLIDRFAKPSNQMERSNAGSSLAGSMPNYLIQIVAFGGLILTCMALMTPEELTSGSGIGTILPLIGVFAFAGQKLLPEINNIYRSLTMMRFGASAVDALYADMVLCNGSFVLQNTTQKPLILKEKLEICAVTFRYERNSDAGLSDVSVTIKAGERLGIVGATGAGKTTLVDVMLGLLRPDQGELRVDGVAITEQNLRAWQLGLSYVPQDIFLVDASIAENIAIGETIEQIDYNKLSNATRIARLNHFIENELPLGYKTVVGERGVRLSGGQRQRIALARAIYRDAQVIILDEATSALDNLTEREVIDAIDNLPGDKTVVMIAHRLTTLRGCDRILVLEQGRLVEIGAPEMLAAQGGAFKRLLNASA